MSILYPIIGERAIAVRKLNCYSFSDHFSDSMHAFLDGGFREADKNGFWQAGWGDVDFDLDREGVDAEE
jgi:hypothetical protein